MTTAEKCEAIVRKMILMARDGQPVTIDEDWDGWSATLVVGGSHTHVGYPGNESFDQLADNLFNTLHGGPGLSWVAAQPTATTG